MRLVPSLAILALTACATHESVSGPKSVVIDERPEDAIVERAQEPAEAEEAKPAKLEVVRGGAMSGGEDQKTAESAGLLGALAAPDGNAEGIGGLIGTTGTAIGGGGLGSRGTGIGGGGGATGLGGLGTKGVGSGKSGYGRGGGSFGALGVPAQPTYRADPVGAEQYTDHGVNGHVLTEVDAQSTFSIDVDTASYAIARRYLEGGNLPPEAAVRVEEFVNAQHYGDPAPRGEAPFAVTMEAAPDPFVQNHHVLRIGVKAAEPQVERDPVHLTFLVDVSGSMSSTDKLPLAQKALHELVDQLDGEDRVALVTYAGSTGIVLEPTRCSDKAAVHAAIDRLRSGGGTGMASGMELAYDLALKTLEPGTENRVIVLSDGDANIGATSHEQILGQLEDYAKKGITLSTIGFGRGNYKDTLMEQLADKGDGNYHYIDSFAEAKKVFGTDLAGTLQTVARDVKIQVEFDPASVISYRLIGYENRDIADRDFRNDKVDAGEIGSGHTVTALYDLVLRDDPSDRLATVRMRSKPPGPDAPAVERSTTLPVSAIRAEFPSATRDFRIAWTAATFAELLRGSPHVEELTYDALVQVGTAARRNAEDDALVGLIRKASALTGGSGLASR